MPATALVPKSCGVISYQAEVIYLRQNLMVPTLQTLHVDSTFW